ncbi:MAG: HAD family phosphatase [Muribaculaceae bacterium]|nr:HAD family phosphatase [Muribaculaceae bacterium]
MTRNLMFDLGGVIMDIDRSRAVRAFAELGMADADAFFDPYLQRGYFLKLEEGQVSAEEFRRDIRPLFGRPVSDEEIDRGLDRFLIGIPSERLVRLKELRAAGHGVYLLSNTNPIMWNGFILNEFRKLGGDIGDYFDGVVTSFSAKICKPDPRIFRLAAEKFGITPETTTFYDDGPANCRAALELGFKAELVDEENNFMKLTEL